MAPCFPFYCTLKVYSAMHISGMCKKCVSEIARIESIVYVCISGIKISVNIMMESFSDEEEGKKSVISFALYFKPQKVTNQS